MRIDTSEQEKELDKLALIDHDNYREIAKICFGSLKNIDKNRHTDVMLLVRALRFGRDYFLTMDKAFLRNKQKLEAFGIKIREPNEIFLKEVEYQFYREK